MSIESIYGIGGLANMKKMLVNCENLIILGNLRNQLDEWNHQARRVCTAEWRKKLIYENRIKKREYCVAWQTKKATCKTSLRSNLITTTVNECKFVLRRRREFN